MSARRWHLETPRYRCRRLRCSRCKAKYARSTHPGEWGLPLALGAIVLDKVVCPRCLTDRERFAMQTRARLFDYALDRATGNTLVRPRSRPQHN